jgi:hypothetical protein
MNTPHFAFTSAVRAHILYNGRTDAKFITPIQRPLNLARADNNGLREFKFLIGIGVIYSCGAEFEPVRFVCAQRNNVYLLC